MVYSTRFWRATALFHIASTDETAAFGVDIAGASITGGSDPGAGFADDFRDAVDQLLQDTVTARADYGLFDGVKVAGADINGHYDTEPVVSAATNSRAGSFSGMPPQITVVCSLWSGATLGKGNYGRFYLPYSGYTENGTPRMPTTLQGTFRDAFQDFINAVNAASPADSGVVIMSQNSTGSSAKPVQYVRVGRVIDTQRRRRSSLDEAYANAAITP